MTSKLCIIVEAGDCIRPGCVLIGLLVTNVGNTAV